MINISNYSFGEWLDFIFKHPVVPLPLDFNGDLEDSPRPWHFEDSWAYECDSDVLIKYMTKLFCDPQVLIDKYSYEEIDQGLWFIPGPNGFTWAIFDEKVEWDERRRCIDSIQYLFLKLCANYDSGTACYMWWDSFFTYGAFKDMSSSTDMRILEGVLSVIRRVVDQGNKNIKESSLHGIEHIKKMAGKTGNTEIIKLLLRYEFH